MKSGLSFLIAARRCEISELEQPMRTSALVNVVGRLVHALQKERGISNVFLASRGQRFAAQLPLQVAECRQAEAELRTSFEKLDTDAGHISNGARLFSRIAFVLNGLDALPGLRTRVATMVLTPADATAAYVNLISGLLAVVFEAADSATNPEISRLLVAMFNFMQGKEFAGQERAFGSGTFASGRVDSALQQQWQHLIHSEERCVQVFIDFSTPSLRELWQTSQNQTALAEQERLRRMALSFKAGVLDPNLSQAWFDCCTLRIDTMKAVEDGLADELLQLCNRKIAQGRAELHDQQMILAALSDQTVNASPAAADRAGTTGATGTTGTAATAAAPDTPYGPQVGRSILDMVQDQASRLQSMSDELETVRASLNERKLVERAKGLLMTHRKLSEDEAYKMLRQTAMNQNRRLTDVAQSVLAMADFLSADAP
ncbi:MAG: nitrate- and nitrite sensing domain-containing protein [Bdellovibrionales bacterium]|nr:nitrate- and nitrite sensing domain-containing protein [Ramlibacter sp.]